MLANLTGADLSRADLSEADLSGAKLLQTIFGNTNLIQTRGLDSCAHAGPSILDYRTLIQSSQLPLNFLRGCGLPEALIIYLPSLLHQAIQFYSCFISYNHADKSFARRLHDTLQGRGIRCWLDEKQMFPGDDIHEQVDFGIRFWDKVLLCCSQHSLTSWCGQRNRSRLRQGTNSDEGARQKGPRAYSAQPRWLSICWMGQRQSCASAQSISSRFPRLGIQSREI